MSSHSGSSPGSGSAHASASAEPESAVQVVQKTAALARLQLTDEEAARLGPQFQDILKAFRGLEELDVTGREAITRGGDSGCPLRPDAEGTPGGSIDREVVLSNAPDTLDGFFQVPKTLGGGTEGDGEGTS